MKRDGDGSARGDGGTAENGGHGEREQTLGRLISIPHPFAREAPPSQSFSVELFAPPNTQELSSASDATMLSQDDAHNQQQQEEEKKDEEMNENVLHVREILEDMLRTESASGSGATFNSTSEKDREEKERLQLYQLRCCVLDDANLEELEKLPKRMCAYEFKPGDIAWNCRICQVKRSLICCMLECCSADCVTVML